MLTSINQKTYNISDICNGYTDLVSSCMRDVPSVSTDTILSYQDITSLVNSISSSVLDISSSVTTNQQIINSSDHTENDYLDNTVRNTLNQHLTTMSDNYDNLVISINNLNTVMTNINTTLNDITTMESQITEDIDEYSNQDTKYFFLSNRDYMNKLYYQVRDPSTGDVRPTTVNGFANRLNGGADSPKRIGVKRGHVLDLAYSGIPFKTIEYNNINIFCYGSDITDGHAFNRGNTTLRVDKGYSAATASYTVGTNMDSVSAVLNSCPSQP